MEDNERKVILAIKTIFDHLRSTGHKSSLVKHIFKDKEGNRYEMKISLNKIDNKDGD